MPGFRPRLYRSVLAQQTRDLIDALPDAVAAVMLIAAIGCACIALDPAPARVHIAAVR